MTATPARAARPPAPVLHIEGEMTIYRAIELKQALLGDPAPEQVDLSGVTEIDTSGLQQLLLAKRAAQAAGRELRLCGHSPAVIELFDLLHIAAHFGDPMVIDAPAASSDAAGAGAAARA